MQDPFEEYVQKPLREMIPDPRNKKIMDLQRQLLQKNGHRIAWLLVELEKLRDMGDQQLSSPQCPRSK